MTEHSISLFKFTARECYFFLQLMIKLLFFTSGPLPPTACHPGRERFSFMWCRAFCLCNVPITCQDTHRNRPDLQQKKSASSTMAVDQHCEHFVFVLLFYCFNIVSIFFCFNIVSIACQSNPTNLGESSGHIDSIDKIKYFKFFCTHSLTCFSWWVT